MIVGIVVAVMVAFVFGLLVDYALRRRALDRELEETLLDGEPVVLGFDGSKDRSVTVTLVVDTRAFEDECRKASAGMLKLRASLLEVALKLERTREVKLAGMGARYYVRGGLGCRTVEEVNAVVKDLFTNGVEDWPEWLRPLTRLERAELATEAMRAWVRHTDPWRRPDPEPPGNIYFWMQTVWKEWGRHGRAIIDIPRTGRTFNGWGPIGG